MKTAPDNAGAHARSAGRPGVRTGAWAANALTGGVLVAVIALSAMLGAALQARQQGGESARVMILDAGRLVLPIASDPTLNDEQRRARTEAMIDELTAAINAELAAGTIILDATAVHAAPEQAYVQP